MIQTVETEIGGRVISLETGKMAKQANGSVVVSSGDSKVLVTVLEVPEVMFGEKSAVPVKRKS